MTTNDSNAQGEMPKATAEVRGGVTPYLTVRDAGAAADFYKRAFAAEEAFRMPPDDKGRYMHIHLYINGGSLMLSDAFPEHTGEEASPPRCVAIHIQVDDVDMWWARAVEAGVKINLPLKRMFWGDRYGDFTDPFGVRWTLGSSK